MSSRKFNKEPLYTYLNMDRKLLKNGGRKAVKITKEDFLKKLYEVVSKTKFEDFEEDEEYDDDNIGYMAMYLPSVIKDISKIHFDNENTYCSKDNTPVINKKKPNLLGINTFENGLTFLGCMAGGDGEYPVFYIIYYDGKSFRGYVPSYGNVINLDFKTAFYSEGNTSLDFTKIVNKQYKDISEKEDFIDFYCKKQGVKIEGEIVVNFEAVKEDIMNRIEIKED